MKKEIIEFGKKRVFSLDDSYSYNESICASDSDEYIEFFKMIKADDYSFYYLNGTDNIKDGHFVIENDSLFAIPFKNLLGNDKSFVINDDYSDRYLSLTLDENKNVVITFHLLDGEFDGTVELKNVMKDFRSSVDALGLDTKDRLSHFFDELIELVFKEEEIRKLKLHY